MSNKLLLFCHSAPYVDPQTNIENHWLSKEIEHIKSEYNIDQVITVDINEGGDLKDDAFSDDFINRNKGKYKVVLLPDCDGIWREYQIDAGILHHYILKYHPNVLANDNSIEQRVGIFSDLVKYREYMKLRDMYKANKDLMTRLRDEAYDKLIYMIQRLKELVIEGGVIIFCKFLNKTVYQNLLRDDPTLSEYRSREKLLQSRKFYTDFDQNGSMKFLIYKKEPSFWGNIFGGKNKQKKKSKKSIKSKKKSKKSIKSKKKSKKSNF